MWVKIIKNNKTIKSTSDVPNATPNAGEERNNTKPNKREKPIVFILWGAFARSKKSLITNKQHYIIESAHPSPFSARNGFFGSKPFSKTNEFLEKNGKSKIRW